MSAGRSLGRGFLAALAALPVVLHLVGRSGEGAWLVLLLFLAPAVLGLSAARRPGAGDLEAVEVAFLTALGGAFVVPLLPWIFHIDGYSAASVVAHGGLTFLAWAWPGAPAAPTVSTSEAQQSPSGARPRLLLGLWAAWSVGSALRGFVALLPEGAPWLGDLLLGAMLDPFGQRSLVDPARPLGQAFLRLETIAFAWAALELFLAARRRGELERLERRLLDCLKWILVAGLVVGVAEFAVASRWRGDASVLERARAGIGRNNRPLLDHNALGTVLVVLVPLLVAELVRRLGALVSAARDARAWLATAGAGAGLLIGLFLLVSSRSKSALGGVALGLVVLAGLFAISRGGRLKRWFLGLSAVGVLALVGLNLAPAGEGTAIGRIAATRYGHDVLRVLRLDAVGDYVEDNRATVWRGARAIGARAPVTGVGLGNLPRLLPEVHDPADPGWFNPRSENAHSQYLQWYAEEGLVGLLLALAVFGAALVAGLRRGVGQASAAAMAAAAGLVGLALNLVLGHGLLVPATAFLVFGPVGWLLATGRGGGLPARARLLVPAAGLAALAPLLLPGGRGLLPLTDHSLGCYAWDFLPGQLPDRARSVGPDARWFQVWGQGDVMKILLRDVRDPRFAERHLLTLAVDGEVVVSDFELPHRSLADLAADPSLEVNPPAYLRVERPAGVAPGDLVELRLTSSTWFMGSRVFNPDHRPFAARLWPAFFQ